jgi:hypothetical protein
VLRCETDADVAELADALDLGSSSERSEGSSPFIRIFDKESSPNEKYSSLCVKMDIGHWAFLICYWSLGYASYNLIPV